MLRGARGRRATTRAAQIAALAASVALSTISFAADKTTKGSRLVGAGAGSGTMNQALVQAYQNNPQLNSQRAATRATDENVPTALAGYRPRVSGTASLARSIPGQPDQSRDRSEDWRRALHPAEGCDRGAVLRDHRDADAVQRPADSEPHAPSRGPSLLRPRDVAHDRAERAAQRRHRLHEFVADRRHSRAAAQQRERARGDAAADERALYRGRGHAHRRRASGIAALRRQVAAVARGIQLRHRAGAVPASHRRAAAGAARPRTSGRSVLAAHARRRNRPRPHRAPADHDGDVQRRHRAPAGQDRRGRAEVRPCPRSATCRRTSARRNRCCCSSR